MPSLTSPFHILDLPQGYFSRSEPLPAACKGSQVQLGISGSSVVSYTLQPSPQLIWSHSISPTTKISAIHGSSENIYFGTVERKKYTVVRVNTGDEDLSSQKKLSVKDKVAALHSSENDEFLYTVCENGNVNCYKDMQNEQWESSASSSSKSKSTSKVIYAEFIELEDPKDGAVVVVTESEKKWVVRVLGLDGKDMSEIVKSDLEYNNHGKFAYRDGSLYCYSDEQLQVYSINDCSLQNTFNLSELYDATKKQEIIALGNDSVLLVNGNELCLFNTNFGSVLSKMNVLNEEGSAEEGSVLGQLAYHIETSTAIATLYSSKNASVVGVSIEIGKGSLLESLGMGIDQDQYNDNRFSMSDVIIKKHYELDEYNQVLKDIYTTSRNLLGERLSELEQYKTEKNTRAFDNKFVGYLKGQLWDDIDTEAEVDDTLVFDSETDRPVDHDFISEIAAMLLGGEGKLLEFVPEGSLIYLLTHPLFPSTDFDNLLSRLRSHPRLQRQAIVTAPTLDCGELVQVLATTADDEIFRDTVSRITEEYGQETILNAIKYQYDSLDQVVSCVKRLIKLNIGWTLISIFLDAGGLFAWDNTVVTDLSSSIDSEVLSLESANEALTLIDEGLRKLSENDATTVSSLSKRELKRLSKKQERNTQKREGPEVITEEQRFNQTMLALGTPAKPVDPGSDKNERRKQAIRNAHSITRRVPMYTVEKLIL